MPGWSHDNVKTLTLAVSTRLAHALKPPGEYPFTVSIYEPGMEGGWSPSEIHGDPDASDSPSGQRGQNALDRSANGPIGSPPFRSGCLPSSVMPGIASTATNVWRLIRPERYPGRFASIATRDAASAAEYRWPSCFRDEFEWTTPGLYRVLRPSSATSMPMSDERVVGRNGSAVTACAPVQTRWRLSSD